MHETKTNFIAKLLITLLAEGWSTPQISKQFAANNLRTPRGLIYTEPKIDQEIRKLRYPSSLFKSGLYREMLMLLVTGELSLSQVCEALYKPRKKQGKK